MNAQAAESTTDAQASPSAPFEDPLLDALLAIASLLGHASTANAVRAELPLDNEPLSPQYFERAAQRIGLSARLTQRKLNKLSPLLLPCVLLLQDDRTAILLERENGKCRVLLPDTGNGEVQIDESELATAYTGFAFLIKPQHRFHDSTEQLTAQRGHWFWSSLRTSWRIYRDVLLASLLLNLFALASPIFVMNVYDRVVPNKATDTLWVLASGVVVVMLFDFLLRMLRSYFLDLAARKSDVLLSSRLFAQVLGLRLAEQPRSVGSFASQLREFDGLRDFITSASLTALVDLPFVALFLVAIFLLAGPIAWIPTIAVGIVFAYALALQPSMRRSIEDSVENSAHKNGLLVETLTASETVKTLGVQGRLQKQWEADVAEIARSSARSRLLSSSATGVATLATQLSSVAVVVAGVYQIQSLEMSLGGLIAAVMLSGRALAPMGQVANLSTRYFHARSALTVLNQIMQQPVERPHNSRFLSRNQLRGDIEFDKLSFHYPQEQLAALNDVSLRILAGERVALIGRIGSGKSSLLKLLAGLYQADGGALRIDGVDIGQLDPVDLRHNLGYAAQDATLMQGSVRDNLTLGADHIDDARILEAARITGVNRFADYHPQGYDMPVGERGSRLSGGQRQSVALARALLLDPPILLLDEPTGAMDNRSEAEVCKNLQHAVQGKTLLMVTHRAALLGLVDRIVVLDQGRVVADGPKDDVIKALQTGKIPSALGKVNHA